MFVKDCCEATLLKDSFVVPPSLNWTIDMDDNAIRGEDCMILQAVHVFPSIVQDPLISDWVCIFAVGTINHCSYQIKRGTIEVHDGCKLRELFTDQPVQIEVQQMLPPPP
jgi:hypothetical protein